MTLARRISEERERLASAKERLRARQLGQRGSARGEDAASVASVASAPCRRGSSTATGAALRGARPRAEPGPCVASNRRFDYRSPKATGVSVKVHSSSSSSSSSGGSRGGGGGGGGDQGRPQKGAARLSSVREARELVHIDGEFAKRLRHLTSREAALSARARLAEDKLAFAEAELTAKSDMCETLSTRCKALERAQLDAEEAVRHATLERNEAVSHREVARQRVYGMSEQVAELEQALERYKQEAEGRGAELAAARSDNGRLLGELNTELEGLRALLGDSEAALARTGEALASAERRADKAETELAALAEQAVLRERQLSSEKEAHSRAAQKLSIVQTELAARELQMDGLEKARGADESAAASEITRLRAELEAGRAREEGLARAARDAEGQAAQSREELQDRLEQLEAASALAKSAQQDQHAAEAVLADKVRSLEEQIARSTLDSNARLDAANKRIQVLQEELEKAAAAAVQDSMPAPPPPPPPPPPAEQMQREHDNYEEVVFEVDLPDGSSAELLLRPADDPHTVVAAFAREHSLAAHTARKLTAHVFAQLGVEPAAAPPAVAAPAAAAKTASSSAAAAGLLRGGGSGSGSAAPLYFFENKEHEQAPPGGAAEHKHSEAKQTAADNSRQSKLRQRVNSLRAKTASSTIDAAPSQS